MDLQLDDRSALVTGAHRGTGLIIARRLLEEGARVIVHGFEQSQAEAAVAELGGGHAFAADLCSDDCRAALGTLCAEHQVEILINNYGAADAADWQTSTSADWQRAYEQNLMSAVRACQAAVPAMKQAGWGRIINLGTVGSTRPNARMPHYYAAKGALAAMTMSLARELGGTGITVNLVSPGLISTPEVQRAYLASGQRQGWGDSWEAIEPRVAQDIPIGRITRREEVADLVVFLASTRTGAIHGQNLRIDGGQLSVV